MANVNPRIDSTIPTYPVEERNPFRMMRDIEEENEPPDLPLRRMQAQSAK